MSQLHITSGYAARFAHQNYPIGQLRIPTSRYLPLQIRVRLIQDE